MWPRNERAGLYDMISLHGGFCTDILPRARMANMYVSPAPSLRPTATPALCTVTLTTFSRFVPFRPLDGFLNWSVRWWRFLAAGALILVWFSLGFFVLRCFVRGVGDRVLPFLRHAFFCVPAFLLRWF